MKTNPGKVYGTKSYTVSTHRIPTSLHDEAVRLGISISDTLAEGLLAKIRARGGSGIEALRIQLLKKKEERELLDQTIKDLEKSIEIEEEKLREAYNAREIDLTLKLGPAYMLRKKCKLSNFMIMPKIARISLHDLEPGMKIVERKENYVLVETDEKHILPDPEGFMGEIRAPFDSESLRNDIMNNSLFLGYIEDFREKYKVGSWKVYVPEGHAEIRKAILEELGWKQETQETASQ
ncbi:MAG: hypothetical protein M1592_05915 [Candidatus Thermoplasmatota archaeon]|jgi:hypothetical protein|nr:hypothetical protein [Candidatus Thermoplasmatota archaeon]